LEKAREIKVKADEEFNIEKGKLVRQEAINIEAAAQRKVKQAETERKIALSNLINKNRLKVLQAREELLNDLFDQARVDLQNVPKDKQKYKMLLRDLMLQSFLQLMDEEVTIRCRQSDVSLVKEVVSQATSIYGEKTSRKVNVEIDTSNYLPETGAGGIIATTMYGRIICNNTLESRLDLLSEQILPQIRVMLFGHSLSRKFFN